MLGIQMESSEISQYTGNRSRLEKLVLQQVYKP